MNSLNRGLTAAAAYTPFGGVARAPLFLRRMDLADRCGAAWAAFLFMAAAGAAVALLLQGYSLGPIWAVLLLGGMAAVAERSGVAVTEVVEMSASFLPIAFAAVAFGPVAGLVAAAVANAADIRRPLLRWLTYTPVRALTGAAGGLAAGSLGGGSGFGGFLLKSTIALCVLITVDAIFNSLTFAIRRKGSIWDYPRTVLPIFALALPV